MLPAMDVINKLYNTVSHTVNQISYALPGNAVTKEYDVFEQIASAGPGLLWKVYAGSKKSTKQPVSVFVVEKKSLEKCSRKDRDDILDTLKEGVVQLTKIRHPRVLTVQHPLEESRDSIAFATEPIFASLANVLGDRHNVPPSSAAGAALQHFKLHEVEIKTGLLQLSEALAFLHTDARLLHRNVCPGAVIINKEGGWKLFGFDYCVHQREPTVADAAANSNTRAPSSSNPWPIRHYQPSAHPHLQPPLDYIAPEHICAESNEPASDLYSLAILIYALHSADHTPPRQFNHNIDAFRRFATDLEHGAYPNLACVPAALADHVRLSLNARPALRPDVHQLSRVAFFEDERVRTLNYLDTAFQWTNLQKSKFYKGLPTVLAEMPARINVQHVLPALQREFANAPMIPFVLPAFFNIAAACTADEYKRLVHGALRPVLHMREPIQILLILVQHIELLLRQTPAAELRADVLPMLYRALETDQPQMQEMCLSVLPAFAKSVDQATVRNGILPRLRTLCTAPASATALVVNGLVCVGHLLEYMDRWLVLDEVVPFLVEMRTREPAVIMGVVGVLRGIVSSARLGITREVMATKLIPFLMPLCIESNLSLVEFEAVVAMVKELMRQVEVEQRGKLEQLSGMQKGLSTPRMADGFDEVLGAKPVMPLAAPPPPSGNVIRPTTTTTTKKAIVPSSTNDWTSDFAMPKSTTMRPNYKLDTTSPNANSSALMMNLSIGSRNSNSSISSNNRSMSSPTSPPSALALNYSGNTIGISSGFQKQTTTTGFDTTMRLLGGKPMNEIVAAANGNSSTSPMLSVQMRPEKLNENSSKPPMAALSQQDILDFLN